MFPSGALCGPALTRQLVEHTLAEANQELPEAVPFDTIRWRLTVGTMASGVDRSARLLQQPCSDSVGHWEILAVAGFET